MKTRSLLVLTAAILCLLMLSTSAFATSSASLQFQETDLGGGLLKYDYTFFNTSDNDEYLYKVYLLFEEPVTVTGSTLPTGWFGTVWEGTNTTSYLHTMSVNPATYIAAGDSLGGFSFTLDLATTPLGGLSSTVNSQTGEVPFHAEFLGTDSFNGTTVVPEPLGMILFAVGGGTMALRYRLRRKK